jgi:hypothetical protein
MKYNAHFILITIFFGCISAIAQPYKILPNTFYVGGESLKFTLRYGFIVGGFVTLDISETTADSKGLQHIIGIAKTTGIADKLFKVNDIYESYIDRNTGLPVMAIQNVHEGKRYKYFNEVHFNRQKSLLTSTKSGEHKVPEGIQDMISVFYYIRRLDFTGMKEGNSYKLLTFFSDAQFPLELRYRGKENISTKWGKISCLKFSPVVEPGRVFKSKDDMFVWYTDDENRIPILITMEMVVGHMSCELSSYNNLKTPPIFKK